MQQEVWRKKKEELKMCNTAEFGSKCDRLHSNDTLHSGGVTADLISPQQENVLTLLLLLLLSASFSHFSRERIRFDSWNVDIWIFLSCRESPEALRHPGKVTV